MSRARSDKLHQRAKQYFTRKPATKSPRDRILLVCEGEVTEPYYFEALCRDRRLTINTDVKICGKECGSAPSSVYKYAKEELERNWRDTSSDDYDRVYCIFDKDKHACYAKTLKIIQQNKKHKLKDKSADMFAINSVPCFEFWVLLHFEYSAKPLENSSAVEKFIKKKWPAYSKTKTKNIYPYIKDRTDGAIKNAKIILKTSNSDNPSTKVHVLVAELIEQSEKI